VGNWFSDTVGAVEHVGSDIANNDFVKDMTYVPVVGDAFSVVQGAGAMMSGNFVGGLGDIALGVGGAALGGGLIGGGVERLAFKSVASAVKQGAVTGLVRTWGFKPAGRVALSYLADGYTTKNGAKLFIGKTVQPGFKALALKDGYRIAGEAVGHKFAGAMQPGGTSPGASGPGAGTFYAYGSVEATKAGLQNTPPFDQPYQANPLSSSGSTTAIS
jgi:hypothetical protein